MTTMWINDEGLIFFGAKTGARKVAFWGVKSGFLRSQKWLFWGSDPREQRGKIVAPDFPGVSMSNRRVGRPFPGFLAGKWGSGP